MKEINHNWLDYIWGYIGEGNATKDLNGRDMNELTNIKYLADQYISPYFSNLPDKVKETLKTTWEYCLLNDTDTFLSQSLQSVLPPFDVPRDMRWFLSNLYAFVFSTRDALDQLSADGVCSSNSIAQTPWDYI